MIMASVWCLAKVQNKIWGGVFMHAYREFASVSAVRWKALRTASSCSVLAIAMVSGVSAHAQEASSDVPETYAADIIVTGSRIKSGFNQPTPVAVKTAEDLQSAQPVSIAYALVQAPQFAGSTTSRTLPDSAVQRGTYLNLRGLGVSRTLILQDGDRVPPTSFDGLVDVEVIPEMLVSRVDVVTAGVSAVYGSDAVAGVVNYVIDKKFKGLKLLAQTGVSTYGDAGRYELGLAAGADFAGGRGHILFSAEHEKNDEIQFRDRPEFNKQYGFGGRGTTASPYTLREGVVWGQFTRFPNISQFGPFVGTTFNADGTAARVDPGTSIGAVPGTGQIGGTGTLVDPTRSLLTGATSTRLYSRLSYDVSDNVNVFVEGSYSKSKTALTNAVHFAVWLPLSGNPYLANAGVTYGPGADGFPLGVILGSTPEFGTPSAVTGSDAWSVKAGLQSDLGAGWQFRTTYVHGEVKQNLTSREFNMQHLYASLDAVTPAGGGAPVCYVSTLAPNPLPGCIPFNPYGANRNANMAGLNSWLFANSISDVTNKMDVFSGSINGSPFDLPAGAVSVSLSAEYRNNSLVRTSNSDLAVPLDTLGGAIRGTVFNTRFGITNTGLINGSTNVKEVGLEVLAPITSAQSAIGELSVSAAGRWTDYSNSGTVYTWKGGATWAPINQLRFRVTRSRDIRAPNLFELFAGRTSGPANTAFQAPFNTASGNLLIEGGGNARLKPEVANTLTFGAVFEPTRNLSVSADFYDINLRDAIQSVPFQTIVGQCGSSGFTSPVCSNITLSGGGKPTPALVGTSPTISTVFSGPLNLASLRTRGIDVDASYTVPLGAGQLNLRANANFLLSFKSQSSALAPIVSQAGYIDTADSILLQDSIQPKLRGNISTRYVTDSGLNFFVQARYIGKLNQGEVPGLTAGQQTFVYAQKSIGAVVYVDTNISQTIKSGPFGGEMEIFANVNNLFNKRPPVFANPTQPGNTYPTYARLYDVMGRYFTVGAKMKF
ncbi:hypothetical protein DBR17_00320 [Sphingomonas sp. HMWF008]|nr:hypothetical protein DBR17_00320 [Sphingomonas sp. HMWF008]